jgi:hypothetical protein
MIFMQPSQYPKEPYAKHISPRRIHMYTTIQVLLFALLYVIKSIHEIAIAFPIIIALCIPIRLYLLPKFFNDFELILLDSEDSEIDEWLGSRPTPEVLELLEPSSEEAETDMELEEIPPAPVGLDDVENL